MVKHSNCRSVAACWRPTCLLMLASLPLLFLASCAAPRQAVLQDADFRLRGRVGVRSGDEAFSANFDWQQAGERYRIAFWGPFGQGRALIEGDDLSASLRDAAGAVVSGADPGALLEQALGWAAPVSALRYWVRGSPAPALPASAEQRDDVGNLAGFEQSGWTVRLSRWRETAIGTAPGRVVAQARAEQRTVTVVCKEWSRE